MRMNRRNIAAAIGLGLTWPSTLWRHSGAQQETPAPGGDIVTIQAGDSLKQLAKSLSYGEVVLHLLPCG